MSSDKSNPDELILEKPTYVWSLGLMFILHQCPLTLTVLRFEIDNYVVILV